MNTTTINAGTKIEVSDIVGVAEEGGRVYPIVVATVSADTSSGMAAELLGDLQQRNYGAAETKARKLWNQLGREEQEQRRTDQAIKNALDETERMMHQQRVAAAGQAGREEPDIFLKEMDYRIQRLNQVQETQHSEGMRAGFMYARAIYKGTRK